MEPGIETHLGERLHLLVERELAPGEEAAARAHLSACASCAAEHSRLSATLAAMKSLGRTTAPAGFATRVLRRVRFGRRGAPHPLDLTQKVPYEGGIVILLAAAAAAAIIGWQVLGVGRLVAEAPPEEAPGETRPN